MLSTITVWIAIQMVFHSMERRRMHFVSSKLVRRFECSHQKLHCKYWIFHPVNGCYHSTEFYRVVLQSSTEFYRVLQSSTEFYKILLSSTEQRTMAQWMKEFFFLNLSFDTLWCHNLYHHNLVCLVICKFNLVNFLVLDLLCVPHNTVCVR